MTWWQLCGSVCSPLEKRNSSASVVGQRRWVGPAVVCYLFVCLLVRLFSKREKTAPNVNGMIMIMSPVSASSAVADADKQTNKQTKWTTMRPVEFVILFFLFIYFLWMSQFCWENIISVFSNLILTWCKPAALWSQKHQKSKCPPLYFLSCVLKQLFKSYVFMWTGKGSAWLCQHFSLTITGLLTLFVNVSPNAGLMLKTRSLYALILCI